MIQEIDTTISGKYASYLSAVVGHAMRKIAASERRDAGLPIVPNPTEADIPLVEFMRDDQLANEVYAVRFFLDLQPPEQNGSAMQYYGCCGEPVIEPHARSCRFHSDYHRDAAIQSAPEEDDDA